MAEVEDIYDVVWSDHSPRDLEPRMTVRGTAIDGAFYEGIVHSEAFEVTDPTLEPDVLGAWRFDLMTAPRRMIVTITTKLPVQVGTHITYTSFRRDGDGQEN